MTSRNGIIATSLFSLTLALAGCDLGGSGSSDNGEGAVGLQCSSELTTTGTFEPTNGTGLEADPDDPTVQSCLPVGKWTVNVAVADKGTCQNVTVLPQYVYTVTENPVEADRGRWIISYDQDPNNTLSKLSVTIEGPCIGIFTHLSPDGKEMITLRPSTDPTKDLTLTGSGTFELFNNSQLDNAE